MFRCLRRYFEEQEIKRGDLPEHVKEAVDVYNKTSTRLAALRLKTINFSSDFSYQRAPTLTDHEIKQLGEVEKNKTNSEIVIRRYLSDLGEDEDSVVYGFDFAVVQPNGDIVCTHRMFGLNPRLDL